MPGCLCVKPPVGMRNLKKVYKNRSASSPRGDRSLVAVAVDKGELAALASSVGAAPTRRGVLLKYTNVVKGWKRRMFALENGVLTYGSAGDEDDRSDDNASTQSAPLRPANDRPDAVSTSFANADSRTSSHKKRSRIRGKRRILRRHTSKEEKERDIKGRINLQFAVISPHDSDDTRFAIDVGYDVYHCRCETESERDSWVSILNESNNYFKGLITKAAERAHNRPAANAHLIQAAEQRDKSEESDNSVIEDDGLREAEESRKALLGELTHVVEYWRGKWLNPANATITVSTEADLVKSIMQAFCSDRDMARCSSNQECVRETAKSLLDLTAWCLQVLTTNDEMYDRRLKADLARMMGRAVPVYPPNSGTNDAEANRIWHEGEYDDDSDHDLEFFDALSRSASINSARLPMPGGTVSSEKSVARSVGEGAPEAGHTVVVAGDAQEKSVGATADEGETEEGAKEEEEKEEEAGALRRVRTNLLGPPTNVKYSQARTSLPKLKGEREKLNIWSLVKDSIGKDLSKMSIPVVLNEPLSFLQRLAEDVEYSECFDNAAACADQYERMMWVATGIISHYSSTLGRVNKPFNPLLGETYEMVLPDKGNGLRFISEQVSHHPPISACYAEGSGGSWKYYNSIEIKSKFWGKSLELYPTGLNFVEIPEYGDVYSFEQVTACVHNIVVGRLWLDNYGDIKILNRTTGDRCLLTFNKTGWMSDSRSFASIKASIVNRAGKEQIRMGGNWSERVYRDNGSGKQKTLWTVAERPPTSASNGYNWTKWAITLNEPVDAEVVKYVAPTDSRFRPDQRSLENGRNDEANGYKQRLEQGQRERRAARQRSGEKWTPLWFDKLVDDKTGKSYYMFNGKYFDAKSKAHWDHCPDLFSCAYAKDEAAVVKTSSSASSGNEAAPART